MIGYRNGVSRSVLFSIIVTALGAASGNAKTTLNREVLERVASALTEQYGNAAAASGAFVGTEACLGCHKMPEFRNTMHATGLKTVATDARSMTSRNGIVVDYDKNGVDDFKQGLDFNKIGSAFDKYKPNAPILGYKAGKGYTITIGQLEMVVAFAHGGSGQYKQRFVVRIPVTGTPDGLTAAYYYAPVQFNETSGSYVYYPDPNWYKADNSPAYTLGMRAS